MPKKKETKPKISPEVAKEVKKRKYPQVLDELTSDINIPTDHADNIANNSYLEGEKSMLAKVKEALSK